MNCPYCGAEMEKGIIQSQHELFWTTDKKKLWLTSNEKKGDVPIAQYGLWGNIAESFLCRSCEKVVIDYGKRNDTT